RRTAHRLRLNNLCRMSLRLPITGRIPPHRFSARVSPPQWPNDKEIVMSQTKQQRNKALVLEAFDTLFNRRDYVAAERYWSPTYIQHSAHIAGGREGLFNLIKSMPPTLKYEPGVIVADGDFVIVHG